MRRQVDGNPELILLVPLSPRLLTCLCWARALSPFWIFNAAALSPICRPCYPCLVQARGHLVVIKSAIGMETRQPWQSRWAFCFFPSLQERQRPLHLHADACRWRGAQEACRTSPGYGSTTVLYLLRFVVVPYIVRKDRHVQRRRRGGRRRDSTARRRGFSWGKCRSGEAREGRGAGAGEGGAGQGEGGAPPAPPAAAGGAISLYILVVRYWLDSDSRRSNKFGE